MKQEVLVSVCCMAYNHEKYIEKTLQSIISQKTKFSYEVLICDDASTDGTRAIIEKYEKKYPDIIKGIYHETNQYGKGNHVFLETYEMARGKYIATCECDDYWVDENKIEQQCEIMEKNDRITLCTHTVRHINEDGSKRKVVQPSFLTEGEINGKDFVKMMLTSKAQSIFHYSSYFFRKKDVEDLISKTAKYFQNVPVGDIFIQLHLANKGNVYYIQKEMSHYRRNSVGSWTSRQVGRAKKTEHINRLIHSYNEFDLYTHGEFHKEICDYTNGLQFQIWILQNDYRAARRDRVNFAKLPVQKKIRIFLCGYFPGAEKIYDFLKNRKNEV